MLDYPARRSALISVSDVYLQHTFTMRLFKRYMADTSPQLVSAVSISQDVAANGVECGAAAERPKDERSKTDDRLENSALPAAKEDADAVRKESTDSILTRKGRRRYRSRRVIRGER